MVSWARKNTSFLTEKLPYSQICGTTVGPKNGVVAFKSLSQADFPWKTQVNAAVADMNEDLGCVKVLLVAESEVSTVSAPFTNGIVFAFEDMTGAGCYSALGKAPGFIGRSADDGNDDITDFGVPSTWQLISLGQMALSS